VTGYEESNMTRTFRWLACCAVLALTTSTNLGQDAELKTVKDERFGYAFQHRELKESAFQMDTTLVDVFVTEEPGSYIEVEWLKPRDHDTYLKSVKLGFSILDLKATEEKEVAFSTRKATRIVYESTKDGDGTRALHLIEKADQDQWFIGVTCFATGEKAESEFKLLIKAADSLSLDMTKAPSKAKKGHYVDTLFGFHLKTAGFKQEAKPWKEATLKLWALYEGETHLGTFIVKMVRREADIEKQMADLREIFKNAGRKIVSEVPVEVDGVKGVNMNVEFTQAGVKNVHDQYILWADDVIWNVVAAYRPTQAEGKETELRNAVTSFKPPAAKKQK
jgi:hypothetical protein